MIIREVVDDLLFEVISLGTRSDVDNHGFDVCHHSLDGFVEILVITNLLELSVLTEVWQKCLDTIIILLNRKRKIGRAHIFWVALSKLDHPFLAFVFGADERKDICWGRSISNQVFSLIDVLREVFKSNSWKSFLRHGCNQGGHDGIVILVLKAVFFDKLVEVQHSQVGSLCKNVSDRVSSGTNSAKDADNLWK